MDKNQDKPGIRKGDAFVQMNPHPLVYMEVNEVEGCTDSMEFCIVTWYTFNEKGLMFSDDSLWRLAMVNSVTLNQFLAAFLKKQSVCYTNTMLM